MKKQVLKFSAIILMTLFVQQLNAQRFLTEIFPSAQVTQNVIYANNFTVISGTPTAQDLLMDVYEPGGMVDPMLQRPLIVYLHTGSFLPAFINQTPTGNRRDSATAEMCRQFARRGYVVAAMSYRVGWNPAATGGGANEDIRRGTLLSAVYRSIQDAKACVRFMRKDAATTNTFKIDSTKIILGGQGSGGYTALAYATLDDPSEIALPKFLANFTIPAYGFVAGQPYVNQAFLGDFDGYGGVGSLNNPNNSVGHTNNVQFVFNMGGAIGDSIWMEAGDAPMAAVHVVGDPFAPFGYGPVIVPTTGDYVVDVSGSYEVVRLATNFGNNNCFISAGFTDPYTLAANAVNDGLDGLFPFYTNPTVQSGPWEWFDSLAVVAGAQAVGLSAAQGAAIYNGGLLTNPDMSKTKALSYIDTIQNYINPRIVYCLGLPTSIEETETAPSSIDIYPNPVQTEFSVKALYAGTLIRSVDISDIAGHLVKRVEHINSSQTKIDRDGIAPGVYFVRVNADKGSVTRKIVFK